MPDVGEMRFRVAFKRSAGLRHLHQGDHALLHSRAARRSKQDNGHFIFRGKFKRARYLLSDNAPHARHHEIAVHNADNGLISAYRAGSRNDRFVHSALFAQRRDFLFISWEIYRIKRRHSRVEFNKTARTLEQQIFRDLYVVRLFFDFFILFKAVFDHLK